MGVERFDPVRLAEGNRSHGCTMLSEAYGKVSITATHGLGRFRQTNIASDKYRAWIRRTERSYFLNPLNQMETTHLFESYLRIDI
jgi:hypothetical protein